MALETDIKNPDSHLQVTFYSRDVKNEFRTAEKSKEAGRELEPHEFVSDTVDYIKIQIPGNKNLEIDTPVRDEHKKRFPMHWAAYQNRTDEFGRVVGTPIENWPRIKKEVAEELRAIRFHTVEAVAGASDAQLQSIGMIAGQNAFTFRDDARRFLMTNQAAEKMSEADRKEKEANEKLAAAQAEILRLREESAREMEEMRAQMKQLMEMALQGQGEERKPGRPRKEAA